MADNLSGGNYTNNGMGGWCSSAMDGKSYSGGYTNNSQPEGTTSIWVNGCCVMRSPITEPDRSGDTIKITALSGEPGNPRLTDDPCILKSVCGKYRSKSISSNQHQQKTWSTSGKQHS